MNYFPHEAAQIDKLTFAEFWSRSKVPTGGPNGFYSYGSNTYPAAIGFHTTLGYNATYVGGAGSIVEAYGGPESDVRVEALLDQEAE